MRTALRLSAAAGWLLAVPQNVTPPIVTDSAPINTVTPTISGTATVGQTLTAANGTWSNSPTSYTYQWQNSPDSTTWTSISGATSSTYVLQSADTGDVVRVQVTAINTSGSTEANSAATATVASGGTAPANTAIPTISGTTVQGDTLTTTNGTWSGSPTSYTYVWQRSANGGTSWTAISGATASTYVLASADVGDTIRTVVTATNASGSTPADSAATAQVTASSTAWSYVQHEMAQTTSTASSISTTFDVAVSIGHVIIVVASGYANGLTLSFADTAGTTYHVLGTLDATDTGATMAIAYGIAASTTPGTIAASWSTAGGGEIYIAEFVPASGTLAQDGSAGTDQATTGGAVGTPITTACSGTSGTSDLLINYLTFGDHVYDGSTSPWVTLSTQNGNGAAYALAVAGSTAADSYQDGSGPYASLIAALKTS